MSNLKRNGQLRWAPSYLRNRGQLTRAQKRAIREWWPQYGIRFKHGETIDLEREFPGNGPLVLEIGFGMGDHLIHLARELPSMRVLGVEVHRPGLAAAIGKAHEVGLENLKVVRGDARLVLSDHIRGRLFSAVFVQFPDPWPKPGDAHRRLIQTDFLSLLGKRMKAGGELLLVTDVEEYAEHCLEVARNAIGWESVDRSTWQGLRIETGYEKKAIEEERTIQEFCFRYTQSGEEMPALAE